MICINHLLLIYCIIYCSDWNSRAALLCWRLGAVGTKPPAPLTWSTFATISCLPPCRVPVEVWEILKGAELFIPVSPFFLLFLLSLYFLSFLFGVLKPRSLIFYFSPTTLTKRLACQVISAFQKLK